MTALSFDITIYTIQVNKVLLTKKQYQPVALYYTVLYTVLVIS